jgi:hypothetical protein
MAGEVGGQELSDVAWETRRSVEANANVEFAWRYWTDVRNWDDPPARFEFAGPFVAGARGLTHLPGQPAIEWFVRDVAAGTAATLEIPAEGATLFFQWRFEPAGEGRTLLTQRIVLRGEKAGNYLDYARVLEENIPISMKKMACAMEAAQAEATKLGGQISPNV